MEGKRLPFKSDWAAQPRVRRGREGGGAHAVVGKFADRSIVVPLLELNRLCAPHVQGHWNGSDHVKLISDQRGIYVVDFRR